MSSSKSASRPAASSRASSSPKAAASTKATVSPQSPALNPPTPTGPSLSGPISSGPASGPEARRSLIYRDPMGPPVRIGALQHQEVLRIDRVGRFVVRHSSGAILGKINPEDGVIEIRTSKARAARMGWRLVVAKKETAAEAAQWIIDNKKSFKDLTLEILELGHDYDPFPEPVTSKEGWIVSQIFTSSEEAQTARAAQARPALIGLLEVRLESPSGEVVVAIGGRAPLRIPGFVRFEPVDEGPHRIILHDVIVGVGFHWQHLEDQKYRGVLEARIDNSGKLTAISELPLEEYLYSVNSSEMMSQCPMSLLEAQTIAARNTILATMDKHHHADDFDICADDHCQCYRGSSRETDLSRRAVLNTLGEVLCFGRRVCDCRYSKICGGISEDYDSCWEGDPIPYMTTVWDGKTDSGAGVKKSSAAASKSNAKASLRASSKAASRAASKTGSNEAELLSPATTEERAAAFIAAYPDVYCNTQTSKDVPAYLKYSARYFRWKVEFTREEFEASLNRFPSYRVGEFRDFEVISRGKSGRIEAIRVIGSTGSVVISRQYEIREAFAPFFLYSSCFVYTIERDKSGKVQRIVFNGAGWGHGAGLCQIGASMMAHRGKSCGDILSHYYLGTCIRRLYGFGADLAAILRREQNIGDLRIGDRCYEYYNCYAVARCPVYHQKIALRAQAAKSGDVEFRQTLSGGVSPVDLESMNIVCEFLNFSGDCARKKPGVE